MIFKGFVETKDKKCVEKFKNRTDFKTLEQVQSLPEYAGILAEDAILVDIDDFEQSEIMFKIVEELQLNCRVYETTRGKHFLFKNAGVEKCFTHCKLAIGLTADIKVGVKNSYEVLKVDGQERPIIYDIFEDEGDEYQEIPKWMTPVRGKAEFIDMDAGDGRNQALFNYILTLQAADFEVEEARDCLRKINQYVLKEPLTDEELEVIMRDEAFSKPVFYKGTTFLFDKFAVFLKNNHHIIRMDKKLYMYHDGIYTSDQEEIEYAMVQHIPGLSAAKRMEVWKYLNVIIRDNTPQASVNRIAFRNGIYDMNTGDLLDFSPDIVLTNKIPWDFNANAYSEETDKILDNISCGDKEIRMLLEEIIGSCFYRKNTLAGGKGFILTGVGANGKSTFLDALKVLLGEDNHSVLGVQKLSDRFSTIMLKDKLANIGDDISDEFMCDTEHFKKIVTGNSIDAEQKGQPKIQFKPFCKLIFSANNIPRLGKGRDSSAIIRRLVIVPFNAKFTKDTSEEFNSNVGDIMQRQESMEYMIQLGIQGLKRVIENQEYTSNSAMQSELEEYEKQNNPMLRFYEECEQEEFNLENEPTTKIYNRYKEFCVAENLQPVSKVEFSRQTTKQFGFVTVNKRINGKVYRVFQKEGDSNDS